MPELPEVERARRLIEETCAGYVIAGVKAEPDTIVYDNASNVEFAAELIGRTITGCERRGKQFWMTLSGEQRFPVMHFGMTGMIQVRGQEPTWYRRKVNLGETRDSWPPRFCKLVMKLSPPAGTAKQEQELAFIDPRRLGRLRLVPQPVLSHPPLSALGFDPVLDHPSLDDFRELLLKKKGAVKGVIMDQSFSAGVGNWVADEVLYQSRIHPLCPVPALTDKDVGELHRLLREIPLKAIEVNADSSMFPDDWLFRFRWDKGKTKGKGKNKAEKGGDGLGDEDGEDIKPKGPDYLVLPNGKKATITFVTVAGRTSAVVTELQKMPSGAAVKAVKVKAAPKARGAKKAKGGAKRKAKDDDESSDLSEPSDDDDDVVDDDTKPAAPTPTRPSRADRAAARATVKSEHHLPTPSAAKRRR